MEKKPKTKEIVQVLKEHTAADIKDKALAAGIRTRDRVAAQVRTEAESLVPQRQRAQDTQSAKSSAAEQVENTAQSTVENMTYAGERAIHYGVRKIKEHHVEKQTTEKAEAEVFADEHLPEDLYLLEHHEMPKAEQTPSSGPAHSYNSVQNRFTGSDPESIFQDTLEPAISHDTAPSPVSSDNRSAPAHREIRYKEPARAEADMETGASARPVDRIRQKRKPAGKDKGNTDAGTIRTREATVRSNESIKAPKGREGVQAQPPEEPERVTVISTRQSAKGTVSPADEQVCAGQTKEVSDVTLRERPQPAGNAPAANAPTDSPSAPKTDPAPVKTHERTVRAPDKEAIREKEDAHPRTKEKTAKTKAGAAATGKNKYETSDKAGKKSAFQNEKALPSDKAEQKKIPAGPTAAGTGDAGQDTPKRPALKQKKRTPPKVRQKPTLQKAIMEKPVPKTPPAGLKQISRQSGSAAGVRSIRTVSEKTKETGKAAGETAKAAKKTSKAVKQTEEQTKRAAQAAKQAAQITAKAIIKTVKASAKAVTSLAELLGVSAPVVLLIIIICLIAAIGGTCFGIFLSNDRSSGSEMTMSQAITQLTTDYYESITKFQGQYSYDELEVKGSTSIRWKDVLTIYAVKYTNDSDGFEVVTLDKKKLKKIKQILLDMNPCTGVVVEKVVPVTKTVTGSSGQKVTVTTYESQKVLIVTAVHVSATEQAKLYDFSKDARGQVRELLSSDYDELWNELIGSSGEIIVSSSTHVPNFIFTWPLDGDYRISSGFGTRTDPITGVVKAHGGTDIAAATGTPILAAADGVVAVAGYNAGGYGYYVRITHGNGYETLYGHCSVLLVSTGQTVKQGQVIAKVGSTGHSTGPHLHFEVRYNGTKVDPMQFFK